MKKFIIILATLAAAATGADAQILWKISGNGSKGTSYLFGTHHLAPVSVTDSIDGFNQALAGVDAVAGEVDMASMRTPESLQMIYGMTLAPADSTLTSLLSPEQTDSVNTVLARYTGGQMTVDHARMLKPAGLAQQMAIFAAMEVLGQEQIQAVLGGQQLDGMIQDRATTDGKKILYFETPTQQMQILMGNPLTEQVSDLMESVRGLLDGSGAQSIREITDAYMAQDIEALGRAMSDPAHNSPESLDRLLYTRNAAWVQTLSEWLPQESVFIAVGAGHLPGDRGLISLLRQAGYEVTPVQ